MKQQSNQSTYSSYPSRTDMKITTGRNSILNGIKSVNNVEQDRLIVIGSGVAGCAAALVAAECYNIPVTMIDRKSVV